MQGEKRNDIVLATKRRREKFMKKFVLLIIAILIANTMTIQKVNASNKAFYEAEYAGNIYLRRSLNGEVKYQRARMFREQGTNNIAYCIEPFVNFGDGTNYEEVNHIENLSEETLQKLSLYAHYGYLYPGHEDIKWYAITQYLIWRAVEPNAVYEYTDGLNGNAIYPYIKEMNELIRLVGQHMTIPNFGDPEFTITEDEELILKDRSKIVSNYETTNKNVEISENTLKIKGLKEGTHIIHLTRKAQGYQNPALFYHKANEQKLMTIGNGKEINMSFKVNVKKTELEITKIDKDTNSEKPSGEGSLIGAKYGLYDKNDNLIRELVIGTDNKASIKNLPFGTYYLKEIAPGTGYQLDENIYKVDISAENTIIKLKLANEIIKKKIKIEKEYGVINNTKKEANITFDIYDKNGKYITSITTDENGYAEVELPYGTYIIKQKNTTKNYKPVEDFLVEITEQDQDLTYKLYDYIIDVPNTNKNEQYPLFLELVILLGGVYIYQKQNI